METQLMVVALLWSLSVVSCEVIQLSCNAIKELLDGHNDRRMLLLKGKVAGQPTAASMKFMVWDEELATKAKNWASGNEFKHNPNKQIKSRRFTTGENLYWFSTTDRNHKFVYDKALAAWWDEHKDFTFQKLNRKLFGQRKKVGHYTQMAWADSLNLGCGLSVEQRGKWKNFYLVCNYGPAGNYLGDTPYKKGTSEGQMICESPRCPQPYGESCYFKPKPF